MDEYVKRFDFDQFRRFHDEQMKDMMLKVQAMRDVINQIDLKPLINVKNQNVLSKQLRMIINDINFLKKEIIRLEKKIDGK